MRFLPFDRAVDVAKSIDLVTAYVAHVPNLPRWTRFFVDVGAEHDGAYQVTTQAGAATTWTETKEDGDAREVALCTRFADREERARVQVTRAAHGTAAGSAATVRFFVRLPEAWGEAKVAQVLKQVEGELGTLKRLLEGEISQFAESKP